jgi:hypothetical protein
MRQSRRPNATQRRRQIRHRRIEIQVRSLAGQQGNQMFPQGLIVCHQSMNTKKKPRLPFAGSAALNQIEPFEARP